MAIFVQRFSMPGVPIVLLSVLSLLLAAPVYSENHSDDPTGSNSCNLDGSWYLSQAAGFGPYTLNVAMTSFKKGSGSIVWTGFDPTLFGLCPGSVEITIGQGAISRTGQRSFESTMIECTKDASGQVECIGKSIFWIELDRGCTSGRLNGYLELYSADQNPFGDDEPFIQFPPTPEDYPMTRISAGSPD